MRDRHDALRDAGVTDPDVRDLFLGRAPEGKDLKEWIGELTKDQEKAPAVLRPFLPQQPNQDASKTQSQAPQTQRRDQSLDQGRKPPAGQTPFTPDQIDRMSPEEFRQNQAAIYKAMGLPVPTPAAADKKS